MKLEGNRKFLICILFIAASILLVVTKKVPSEGWLEYTAYVVLAYFGGNSMEWFTKRGGQRAAK